MESKSKMGDVLHVCYVLHYTLQHAVNNKVRNDCDWYCVNTKVRGGQRGKSLVTNDERLED